MLSAPFLTALAAMAEVPPVQVDVSQQIKYFSQTMVHVEAENFTVADGATWSPRRWGGDGGFFASTVANTFHSRRGYLHAPANSSTETVATAMISVSEAGTYSVLARYETGYRFQQPFRLDIGTTAAGAPLFTRMYGYREAEKLQAFGGCPTDKGQPPGRGQLQAGRDAASIVRADLYFALTRLLLLRVLMVVRNHGKHRVGGHRLGCNPGRRLVRDDHHGHQHNHARRGP